MSTAVGLPDLLRRFVATPHRFGAVLHSTAISFETNDQELLTIFRARAEELAGVLVSSSDRSWLWKVVRDYDVGQDGDESVLLIGEALGTLFLGTGTVLAIDWHQNELLGFVAANVSAQYVLDAVIDVARQHHLNYECGTAVGPCDSDPT